MSDRQKSDTHLVWDLPLRLFHWLLAVCVIAGIISGKMEALSVHQHTGMAVMGLVLFRLIWGFSGSQTARFARFIRPVSEVIQIIQQIKHGKADKRAGHSALGGYAVLYLLGICLVMSVSGAFSTDDVLFEGPFVVLMPGASPMAETVHSIAEKFLFLGIFLHLLAMVIYYFRLKKNLVPAMVTGRHKGLTGDSGFISYRHNMLGVLGLVIILIASQLPIFLQPGLY